MTSNQAEMGLKWGDATSQAARNIEQRDFTSAAELRALGISAETSGCGRLHGGSVSLI